MAARHFTQLAQASFKEKIRRELCFVPLPVLEILLTVFCAAHETLERICFNGSIGFYSFLCEVLVVPLGRVRAKNLKLY